MIRHSFLCAMISLTPACLEGDGNGGSISEQDAVDALQLDATSATSPTGDDDTAMTQESPDTTSDGAVTSTVDTSTVDTSAADSAVADSSVVEDTALELPHFSFFVASLAALQDLSGSDQGFGGDLRFGQTGMGAGLRGADLICATIAERSMPGAGQKGWRAFLSANEGDDGAVVDAIDRIGEGPWYDRLGRTFALTKDDVLHDRPTSADAAIKNDFPNEDGVPNHRPDPTQAAVDNHDTLTGSDTSGKRYSATSNCNSWTSSGNGGKPRVGHSWPRSGGGGGHGPGGDMNGASWMSSLTESGCAPGVNLVETGGRDNSSDTVGSGGGYGGFYCFALTP